MCFDYLRHKEGQHAARGCPTSDRSPELRDAGTPKVSHVHARPRKFNRSRQAAQSRDHTTHRTSQIDVEKLEAICLIFGGGATRLIAEILQNFVNFFPRK